MSESIESIMTMLQAMHKEKQAQNELVMQRISGIEEQLRDSKDDVREMNTQIVSTLSTIPFSSWTGRPCDGTVSTGLSRHAQGSVLPRGQHGPQSRHDQ